MKKSILFIFFIILTFSSSQAQWQPASNGIFGNSVAYIYFVGNNVLAPVYDTGELFVSTNNMNSWQKISYNETFFASRMVANGNIIFVGYGNDIYIYDISDILNWKFINHVNLDVQITTLSIINDKLLAGTYKGIYSSTDNGATWTLFTPDITNATVNAIAGNGNNIYAATGYGFYLSTDNGLHWQFSNNGLGGAFIQCLVVGNNKIYVCTNDGVFISTDNGGNWLPGNNGLGSYINKLAISGDTIYGANSSGLYRSTDLGNNWIKIPLGYISNINSISISSNNIYIAAGNGVFVSKNGGLNWTSVNNGITCRIFQIASFQNSLFATSQKGTFKSSDLGNNWTAANFGIKNISSYPITATNSSIFISTGDGLYKSTNAGNKWTKVITTFSDSITKILASDSKNVLASLWKDGIILSEDDGLSWSMISKNLPGRLVTNIGINGNKIYATDIDGTFLTTDKGNLWNPIDSFVPGKYINCFTITEDKFIANTGYGIFYTTDDGKNWSSTDTSMREDAYSIIVSESNIFLSTYTDFYYSTNFGKTWSNKGGGLPGKRIYNLCKLENYIFASTDKGVYKLNLTELGITIVDDSEEMSTMEHAPLFAIFPNPSEDFINILTPNLDFSVSIYNSLGIMELEWENQNRIDIRNLSAGVYFCIIRAGWIAETIRFIKE
ncbi:MAG: BNR/Asp-box repeat protein [Ignavibacteria bacterium]|nr:BNR/Asp-box repeat protein [Ignavibacteria bacterium]